MKLCGFDVGLGHPLFLIAGPCVIESLQLAIETAGRLKEIAAHCGVPFIYKSSFDKANRSSGKSYRGPGIDGGLKVLAEVRRQIGVPVLTDVHDGAEIGAVAAVVDVLQTPAFLCRQTDFIQAVACAGRPVNIKKGQFLAPGDMKNVVDKAREASGQDNIMVCERGASFGYNNLVSDMRSLAILRDTGCPVVFDATHSVQLPGGQGTDFTLSRDTAQSAIPGAVALDLEPTAATVQTSGGGGLRDVDEGTVTISDCPRNRGDVVRGRLQAVVVASAAGASWRMDLDFQVVVTSAAGELHCTSVGGTGGDEGGDEPPARCPNTLCEDLSFGCCPYSECLRDCEAITCNRIPCEGDEGGCRHSCLLGCVDQCGVTGTCVTTIQGLWDCQLDAGCFSGDLDGSEDACTRDRCCDAFTATF